MAAFWAVTVICYISKRKELRLINLKNIRSVLEYNEIEVCKTCSGGCVSIITGKKLTMVIIFL